jgi:hypothetical protein
MNTRITARWIYRLLKTKKKTERKNSSVEKQMYRSLVNTIITNGAITVTSVEIITTFKI